MNFFRLLVLIMSFSATAKNLTPLPIGQQFGTFNGSSQTTASHLFFITKKAKQFLLWSYNSEQTEPFTLIAENANTHGLRLIESFNGDMLFYVNTGEGITLWRTDGNLASPISNVNLNIHAKIGVTKDAVFFTDTDGNLYEWSSNGVTDHETLIPNDFTHCEANSDLTYLFSFEDKNMWQLTADGIQKITHEFNFSEYDQPQFTQLNGICYLSSRSGSVDNTIYELTPEQPVKFFESSVETMSYVFVHNERLYVVGKSENSGVTDVIYKLSEDFNSVEKSKYAPESYYFDLVYSVGQYLSIGVTTGEWEANTFGFLNTSDFLSAPIESTVSQFRINNMFEFNNKIYVVNQSGYNIPDLQIVNEPQGIEKYQLTNQNITAIRAVTNTGAVYVSTRNVVGVYEIYLLTDGINISDQISGSWVNQSLENQGLMIQLSQRKDGSQYVFLTLHTFKDGQPFWLAGMAPYQLTDVMEVQLWEFKGLDFLQAGQAPTQNPLGELKLKLMTCQSLEAELNTPFYQDTLTFSRMEDQSYAQHCNYITPWTSTEGAAHE